MKKTLLLISLIMGTEFCIAQKQPPDLHKKRLVGKKVTAFKSTRIINAHSSEMLLPGTMDFRILHRFGKVSQGPKQFFGLDQALFRMGFDFGITNDIIAGIGRSTYGKEIDGFVKVRFLQQTTGEKEIPVSLLLAGGAMVRTGRSLDINTVHPTFIQRTAAYFQAIAARKFSEKFAFQFSPIVLLRNRVDINENNVTVALGGGARYKVSKIIAITADYHHTISGLATGIRDPLSVGIDIETGGHIFQLHFSNSTGLSERAYLTETGDQFFKGDIRFGFNLSRIFHVSHKK